MWQAIVAILTSPIVGRSQSEMCVTASAAFDVAHPQTRFTPKSGHSQHGIDVR
jgi:hypothetical protein